MAASVCTEGRRTGFSHVPRTRKNPFNGRTPNTAGIFQVGGRIFLEEEFFRAARTDVVRLAADNGAVYFS
jgi:hypothetical protein